MRWKPNSLFASTVWLTDVNVDDPSDKQDVGSHVDS